MIRKELSEYRTNNTKTYLNSDGTIDIEIYTEALNNTNLNNRSKKVNGAYDMVGASNSSNDVIDTYIYEGDSNTTAYNQDIIKVGVERSNNQDTIYRSLLKF